MTKSNITKSTQKINKKPHRATWEIAPYYRIHYDNGDVRVQSFSKHKKGRLLSQYITPSGYLSVKMNPIHKLIHHIVCEHFIGPRPDGLVTNHKDGNKLNNRIENLEYVTIKGNIRHAIEVIKTHVSCDPTRMPTYKDGRCSDRAAYKRKWYLDHIDHCRRAGREYYARKKASLNARN